MYNKYIPQDASYDWVGSGGSAAPAPERKTGRSLLSLLGLNAGGGEGGETGLSALWKQLRLNPPDTGDLLVLVIAALLLVDKKDVDLGIALILVFLLGFGETQPDQGT